jgi:hypothetical protein
VTGADTLAFVERPAVTVQPESGNWYYCVDPAGYFPYVGACNRPWVAVTPFDVQGGAGGARPAP